MAEEKNKKFNINNNFYLLGPLAFVAFLLMDIIGGLNYPGYNWVKQVVGDLVALNSFSFVISMVFAIIYTVLTLIAVYCIYKYYKTTKFNKQIKKGINLFLIAAIVASVGFTCFLQKETGSYDKAKENAQIAMTEVTIDEPAASEPQPDAEDQDQQQQFSEKTPVIDKETTAQNFQELGQVLADNPLTICGLVASLIAAVLSIIGLIFIIIGGFKKDGKNLFSGFAVFCLVLIVYSLIAVAVLSPDLLGINSRFFNYSLILFTAFLSSYVYVVNIEE